jgi:hypothetical protein
MDGAILFSDILMLPYALGQALTFREGQGPILEPIENHAGIGRLKPSQIMSHLAGVTIALGGNCRHDPDAPADLCLSALPEVLISVEGDMYCGQAVEADRYPLSPRFGGRRIRTAGPP